MATTDSQPFRAGEVQGKSPEAKAWEEGPLVASLPSPSITAVLDQVQSLVRLVALHLAEALVEVVVFPASPYLQLGAPINTEAVRVESVEPLVPSDRLLRTILETSLSIHQASQEALAPSEEAKTSPLAAGLSTDDAVLKRCVLDKSSQWTITNQFSYIFSYNSHNYFKHALNPLMDGCFTKTEKTAAFSVLMF